MKRKLNMVSSEQNGEKKQNTPEEANDAKSKKLNKQDKLYRKKDRALPKGIHDKNGYLYYYIYDGKVKKGGKGRGGRDVSTGLKNIPENIPKAVAIRDSVLDMKKSGKRIIVGTATVREVADAYLDSKSYLADTTFATLRNNIRKIENQFGEMQMRRIRKEDLEQFYSKLATSGNESLNTHKGEGLSKRTLMDIKKTVKNLFHFAISENIIPECDNPAQEAEVDENKITKYRRKSTDGYFRYEQAVQFLEIVQKEYAAFYVIFYLVIVFGLRREEANGLKWSAIDLDYNHTMAIQSTITRGTKINKRDNVKTEESNNTTFPFPLDDEQIEMLQMEKNRQKEMRRLFGKQYIENDYVFKNDDGSLHDPSFLYKKFKQILKEHPELPQNVTFHGLRKTTASVLVREKGVTPKELQTWMRHKDIETTLRLYAQIEKEMANEATGKKMSSLFKVRPI